MTTPTPWRLRCPTHGFVFLTEEQYSAQMLKPNNVWKCPHCFASSSWDDAWYEKVPDSTFAKDFLKVFGERGYTLNDSLLSLLQELWELGKEKQPFPTDFLAEAMRKACSRFDHVPGNRVFNLAGLSGVLTEEMQAFSEGEGPKTTGIMNIDGRLLRTILTRRSDVVPFWGSRYSKEGPGWPAAGLWENSPFPAHFKYLGPVDEVKAAWATLSQE